jgi:hypothetical protein
MLRRSDTARNAEEKNIVVSTKGIVFLGTPHRGSPDMADFGETVRKIAGRILRVDSNASLIRALADGSELDEISESFVVLWRDYNFRVKTFQEAWGVTGFNFGPLNEKVSVHRHQTVELVDLMSSIADNVPDRSRFLICSWRSAGASRKHLSKSYEHVQIRQSTCSGV